MKTVFCLLVFSFSFIAIVTAQTTQPNKVQQTAEMFVAAYNAGDAARVHREFNAAMSAAVPADRFAQSFEQMSAQAGKIVKLGVPRDLTASSGTFLLGFERAKLDVVIALDAAGKIAGLRLKAPAPATAAAPEKATAARRNQTRLGLPFKGEWLVVWGGETPEQNYHQNVPNQRFAFDILKTDAAGSTHRGDGKRNEDYYAFGQELVAPADGVVTDVVNGIRDNVPGEMNRMFAPGNTVIIKHSENEYSFFAHLKLDSARVKPGDRVTRGQVIGLCGNSGNSSEAHLHYQINTTPFFADEGSIKVHFEKLNVRREAGKPENKIDYSPVKGDLVSAN